MAQRTNEVSNSTDSNIAALRAALEQVLEVVETQDAPAQAKEKPSKARTRTHKHAPAKSDFVEWLHDTAEARAKRKADNQALAARIRTRGFPSRAAALKAVAGRNDTWAAMVERAYA
jgi:hypothetical protein